MKKNINNLTNFINSNKLKGILMFGRFFGRELPTNYNNQENIQNNNMNLDFQKLTKKNNSNYYINNFPLKEEKVNQTLLSHKFQIKHYENKNKENYDIKSNPFSNKFNKESSNIEEIKYNPQLVQEYSSDIFTYLKENENINYPDYINDIFSEQKSEKINIKTRAIVIDWLVHIHYKFKLKEETLYLTINIMDRFTKTTSFNLNDYQLISICSLLIASKFEDIYPPEISYLIYASKNTYSKEQIIKTEYEILKKLNFNLLYNSSYKFLSYFYLTSQINNIKVFHLAQYILELSFLNISSLKFKQSLRAASVFYMAIKILKENNWNYNLQFHTGFKENELKNCVKDIIIFLQLELKNKSNSIKDKFNSLKYSNIGGIFNKKNVI